MRYFVLIKFIFFKQNFNFWGVNRNMPKNHVTNLKSWIVEKSIKRSILQNQSAKSDRLTTWLSFRKEPKIQKWRLKESITALDRKLEIYMAKRVATWAARGYFWTTDIKFAVKGYPDWCDVSIPCFKMTKNSFHWSWSEDPKTSYYIFNCRC